MFNEVSMTNCAMTPLHAPTFTSEDEAVLLEALRSTWVSTGGPYVEAFEKAIAAYTKSRYAISVVNGTIALQLAFETQKRLQKISGSFEVVMPTLSFLATANSVVAAGGIPQFVDCGKNSWNMDNAALGAFLEQNYRKQDDRTWVSKHNGLPLLAVCAVHVMGWLVDLAALQKTCAHFGLPLIEDAAEALGAWTKNKTHAGSGSLAAVLSFNGNKILTTGGGGMIITNDENFAKRAKHLSTTAKTENVRYVHDEVGYNYRLTNLAAALGYSQLKRLDQQLAAKRRIFTQYKEALAENKKVHIHEEAGEATNHWLVNAVFANESARDTVLKALRSSAIEVRPLWMPQHMQPAYKGFSFYQSAFPHAKEIWEKALSLPSSPNLEEKTIAGICEKILSLV
jgi:perosamine synthetase